MELKVPLLQNYQVVVSDLIQFLLELHIQTRKANHKLLKRTLNIKLGMANASIALDEMNVLYIGYDNKITIAASGGGDDKVQASISGGGGSLEKVGGGKYIAKVRSVTDDCKITVTVDGKVAGVSQFRVRTIPTACRLQ